MHRGDKIEVNMEVKMDGGGWRKPSARAAAERYLGVGFSGSEASVEWLPGGKARVRGLVGRPTNAGTIQLFRAAMVKLEECGGKYSLHKGGP